MKAKQASPHQCSVAILGSTGSIGRQTLDVIRSHPRQFKVFALGAYRNIDALLEQIEEFQPQVVAVFLSRQAQKLRQEILKRKFKNPPLVVNGSTGFETIAAHPKAHKIVFSASGLDTYKALLKAIKARKEIALANKEMMVAYGDKIMKLAKKNHVEVVPIDSEHCAIFQCLQGEDPKNIEKIILTCSGGPFYGKTAAELKNVAAREALKHPTWRMGDKISIDCATLFNKGFELIEAKHFFGLRDDQLEVVIHPESIVHSMVVFKDGSVKAQLAMPDMRIAIAYALAYPGRMHTDFPRPDFAKLQNLTFIKADFSVLRGPILSSAAAKQGRQSLKKLLKKNDLAVQKFLQNKIGFLDIYDEVTI